MNDKKEKNQKEKNLTELLNDAIAMELQVSIQYMWQHIIAVGIGSAAITPLFKKIAIEEMRHAEMIAERLNYLGGVPTTKIGKIETGNALNEMLKINAENEENAIALYRQIIEMAEEKKDYTTRELFEKILSDEESHHDEFTRFLEK